MTLEEAKARILKLYFDYNYFGEDFAIFIDEVYADFGKELDKVRKEGYRVAIDTCFILLTGKDKKMDIDERESIRQDLLEEQYHLRKMVECTEYFESFIIENYIFRGQTLLDIKEEVNKLCSEYGQSANDLMDRLKEI